MLHIDLPTRAQIDQLARYRGRPALSIFLRTTPITQEAQADRIELKNLLKTAAEQMRSGNVDKRAIADIEAEVQQVIDDDSFWATQAHSLAVFAALDRFATFRLPNKLANAVEVSDRFHLSPLIRAVTFPHEAFILAIGVGSARLIELTADLPAETVSTPDMPKDFYQALRRRSRLEKGAMRGPEAMSDSAMLDRYARAVDRGLRPVLAGQEAPLIVAATEPMASTFRRVSSYPNTASEVIGGSADEAPDHALAAEARKILDKIYADEIAAFKMLYATRAGQGRATSDLSQAARAATFGAVDTLMVDMDASVSGVVDEETGALSLDREPDALNYSVLDEIARRAGHGRASDGGAAGRSSGGGRGGGDPALPSVTSSPTLAPWR